MKRSSFFLFLFVAALPAAKFYADDPLLIEPTPRDVGSMQSRKLSDYYDLFLHQFTHPGERQPRGKSHPQIKAKAVNTLGDPMDGDWYNRRHYWNRMRLAELERGPTMDSGPDVSAKLSVVGAKSEGITPGFILLDAKKRRYFVKFDPLSNPELATAADQISSRFFYALGYWVPENHLIFFTESQLELGENVELSDRLGKKRKMTRADLIEVLLKVPRGKDGLYRGTASLAVPGKPIGPPRYFGTRTDDPNDIVPHEHRRDQRALHVFCAWLNHDDSRAINNLDVVIERNGVKTVRHFLLDFGSTLGSASNGPNSARSGAYYFDWGESAKNLFGLGFRVPYWARARYPRYPSIGRFEYKQFDPEQWVPEYPNPAFRNRLPDDEFWGAKQVMAFTDDEIRAVVETGRITDNAAADYLVKCLIERRNKIGKAYYAKVLPLDRFRIRDRALAWEDLSHSLGAVNVRWHQFDNQAERRTPLSATTPRLPQPSPTGFLCAELTAPSRPSQKIFVYLRERGGTHEIVGVDREW
ncbi:MAG TPA: hypothetical protein VM120_29275 [Bryobacteraceae bacterium]|nr:hypothetical protein [Bryobacteraceae bacterium]